MEASEKSEMNGFGGERIAQEGPAFVETISAPFGTLHCVHLQGTHREMGRQYGRMLGPKILEVWEIVCAIAEAAGLPREALPLVGARAWGHYRERVPQRYREELAGIVEGCAEVGAEITPAMVETSAAFPDFSGFYQVEKMLGSLMVEPDPKIDHIWKGKDGNISPTQCSAFAVWGSRTRDGKAYASRNLDWESGSGLGNYASVTVFHPIMEDGQPGIPSAIFGHLGSLGCLAGMNAAGLSLSEIGAFNERETFEGRPWHVAFREVLDEAKTLDEAAEILDGENYTQGYCFVVAWGDPCGFGTEVFQPGGFSMEVDGEYIEFFKDDDPKERDAVWVDKEGKAVVDVSGNTVHYGCPMKDATWRADTAFSATVRSGQATDNGPVEEANDGDPRKGDTYRILHVPMANMIRAFTEGTAFDEEEKKAYVMPAIGSGSPMGPEEAMKVCQMAGDNDGNIMSVLYEATDLKAHVAFEKGQGDTWSPAALNGYVVLDLGPVFGGPVGPMVQERP